MPLVWRGMIIAGDQPETGPGKNLLGVVVGSGERDDIPEKAGKVMPGTGGMSVSPSLDTIPTHRLPKRLKNKYPTRFPDATGSNRLHCWSLGDGEFAAGPLADGLVLRLDPDAPLEHGFVEPVEEVETGVYMAALEATGSSWQRWGE